jgi:hypothetical protein
VHYQSVKEEVEKMERALVQIGFIAEEGKLLTPFVHNVAIHFIDKKCISLLTRARDLILAADSKTVRTEGTYHPFLH